MPTAPIVINEPLAQLKPDHGRKVPVSILTGFLGSGKSTLLRGLLSNNADLKVAVIMNEFGSTAEVEKALGIATGAVEEDTWLSLDNGCMCCASKGAAVVSIERLLATAPDIDVVVVETSGLADPGPVANMFWVDDMLGSAVVLDSIIATVDAANAPKYFGSLGTSPPPHTIAAAGAVGAAGRIQTSPEASPVPTVYEAARQVMYADLIVITKGDLVGIETTADDDDAVAAPNTSTAAAATAAGAGGAAETAAAAAPAPTTATATATNPALRELNSVIDALNPTARRVVVSNGRVTPSVASLILGVGAHSGVRASGECHAKTIVAHAAAAAAAGSRAPAAIASGGVVSLGNGAEPPSSHMYTTAASCGFAATTVTVKGAFADGTALHQTILRLMGQWRSRGAPLMIDSDDAAATTTTTATGGAVAASSSSAATTTTTAAAPAGGVEVRDGILANPVAAADGLGVTYRLKAVVYVDSWDGLGAVNAGTDAAIASMSAQYAREIAACRAAVAAGGAGGAADAAAPADAARPYSGPLCVAVQGIFGMWDCTVLPPSAMPLRIDNGPDAAATGTNVAAAVDGAAAAWGANGEGGDAIMLARSAAGGAGAVGGAAAPCGDAAARRAAATLAALEERVCHVVVIGMGVQADALDAAVREGMGRVEGC